MESSAVLSENGRYRYSLERWWGDGDRVHFVMLNPSTADASQDDPTIRRCIGFAQSWGYDGLIVTNLFAWRATNPKHLRTVAHDPEGSGNFMAILAAARRANVTVCAWGSHGDFMDMGRKTLRGLVNHGVTPYALRMTKGGQPAHPLYLPKNLFPFEMGGLAILGAKAHV